MTGIEKLHLNIEGKEILKGIGLHLQPGDIFGLRGSNGVRKSTTILILPGRLMPGSGADPDEYLCLLIDHRSRCGNMGGGSGGSGLTVRLQRVTGFAKSAPDFLGPGDLFDARVAFYTREWKEMIIKNATFGEVIGEDPALQIQEKISAWRH